MAEPIAADYIRRAKLQDMEMLIKKAKGMGATFIHFVTADELSYHGLSCFASHRLHRVAVERGLQLAQEMLYQEYRLSVFWRYSYILFVVGSYI